MVKNKMKQVDKTLISKLKLTNKKYKFTKEIHIFNNKQEEE